MQARLRSTVAAMMLLAPLAAGLVAQPATAATTRAATAPSINTMSLNSDAGLTAGATLRVQLQASPHARSASVTLGDSGVTIPLRQQAAGNYTGSYVVRRSDRIDPTQLITARVTYGARTYSRSFNYPTSFQDLAAMGAGPAPSARMQIERFVMRPAGRLEPGRELRFRVVGAPGGEAWVDIPGVIRGVDLDEVRPGVYEGTYTVRRRDDARAFDRAVATLRNGNQRATARLDLRGGDREFGRDDRAPQITDLMPANGERTSERGRERVGAHLSDEGSGIDPSTARLRLNGRDVTADARVTPEEIRYRGQLDPGRYSAEVSVQDNAGNRTTKSWTFDVVDRDRAPVGEIRNGLPLQVTSHADNAAIDANGNLAIQGRTAPLANVRVQVESVASVGGVIGMSQPVADQTVQADRDGRFSVLVTPRALPIPGTRFDVHVTASDGSHTADERITLYQRRG